MIFSWPPQFGQCAMSISNTRFSSLAQLSRTGRRVEDGSDDGGPPEDWRGEPRSNDTHQSTTDPESRLYRKSNAAPALPSYL